MTEEEARVWIGARYGTAAIDIMERLAGLIVVENTTQNLIAPSTVGAIWTRHIVDSAQLIVLADGVRGEGDRPWVDIGSGAGFPGLVVAALGQRRVCLVEPRKRRAAFLIDAAEALGLVAAVEVKCARIEEVEQSASVISARAVAQLPDILTWAARASDRSTRWVLPKGRSALEEVAKARETWHGMFHVEHSITDPDSLIVLASGVARR